MKSSGLARYDDVILRPSEQAGKHSFFAMRTMTAGYLHARWHFAYQWSDPHTRTKFSALRSYLRRVRAAFA
jgi:hypothetical protein